jgi:hypothetical protein
MNVTSQELIDAKSLHEVKSIRKLMGSDENFYRKK